MQTRDKWGFNMTARYEMYAGLLTDFVKLGFQPQVRMDGEGLPACFGSCRSGCTVGSTLREYD